jgi:chromosome segregation protein
MYFKSLELIGFKSFAEKTKLNFEPGVTAIVGPNGCGKSNVADAIRWVLGEQSAKSLRASKMEDVIFNGTDTKEPINFAEVSLTFSNESRMLPIDYDEVTISRRVFRSGETEYLLNKTPVRLRDIHELLMGTGIGTESYSIIEQGKMDLILSSKPEDRRFVFEEASGITKYKSKKKEAMRKLEQTEQNLLRISDIIQEVKRQIGSIERQARKAERYKVDFDKLKELEIKLSFYDYKDLKTQEKTLLVESGDLKEREKELDIETQALVSDISGFRRSVDELNIKISELKSRHSEITNSVDMNIHKIQIDKERIEEARFNQEALNKEIASINDKVAAARTVAEKLRDELSKVATAKLAKEKTIADKEALWSTISKEIEHTEEKIRSSKIQIVDLLARETRNKNELIKLGADVQNRNARKRRLSIEKETVERELQAVEQVKNGIEREFENIESRLSSLRSDIESKKITEQSMQQELSSLDSRIAHEEARRAAAISKIEFLEDLIKRHEGFHQGVKSILVKRESDPGAFSGVRGVLANMMKIERGYEEAISMFLGDDAQLVIMEKDSDISAAIDYLKDNKLGKASFLSLETLDRISSLGASSARIVPQNSRPLKDFIKADPQYQKIIDRIFDNAYLSLSTESWAADISSSQESTLLTKTGMKYARGRFSGGSSFDNAESLLIGRQDRVELLKSELNATGDEILGLNNSKREKALTIEALKAELGTLEDRLHAEEIMVANIMVKKDAQEENTKKLREELSVTDLELDEVNQTIEDLTKKGEALNLELNDIEKENSSVQRFIEEALLSTADKRSQKENLALEVATLKTENQSVGREEDALKANLQKEEAFLFELEDMAMSKEGLLKDSRDKVKVFEEEILKLEAENGSISLELKALSGELASIDQSRAGLVEQLGRGEARKKDKDRELESLRNQIRDSDVKLTELNYKKSSLKERILQAYKEDIESIHVELEDSVDWDSIKTQVAELKDKLDKLGPVNLVAIDEHKELEERYSFLVRQQEDLVNAKDSLLKAIQKINRTTKELFLDTFQKIQVEFKTFFKTLFGGGQAELVLIDEQDVLESGIEIIVRPPGKKIQNIMLLSGGEKSLTAIALLFSIFKVKPSPFCVLDELDAPLDESNVVRFCTVLKEFLKMSQFIIITHNKRTIELADVMYGVTMQERGVSKIVSVKFMHHDTKDAAEEPRQAPETPPETPQEILTPEVENAAAQAVESMSPAEQPEGDLTGASSHP